MRLFLLFAALLCPLVSHAIQLSVGPQALQSALVKQLFTNADGRYYLRGKRDTAGCFLYGENPHVQFTGNRIVLQMHLSGKVGSNFGGSCLGVNWSGNAQVSMLPEAEGANIGFTDVRVEQLTSDDNLDRLLQPLLAALVPRSIKVDAGALVTKMLHNAGARSGTSIELNRLQLLSMTIQGDALLLQVDGSVTLN